MPRTAALLADEIASCLVAEPGAVALDGIDPGATPGIQGRKAADRLLDRHLGAALKTLQGRLFAQGRSGGNVRALLVLQGMDASGKSGLIKQIVRRSNPLGIKIVSFGPPTAEERSHDFLWRVRRRLPGDGELGIFDRSHYEDVVAVLARGRIDEDDAERRRATINAFEQELRASGTTVVKCFLHISPEEQRARLLARLDKKSKRWKFDPRDLDDRQLWSRYRSAYELALSRCASEAVPWYVIPADHKWYRDLASVSVLVSRLDRLGLRWPDPDFDVAGARKGLAG
jgi:PPK2 family polyphosphate:nucleotide phosphotransferase